MRIVKSPIFYLGIVGLLYWFGVVIYYSWRDFPHIVNWGTVFAFIYALITCTIVFIDQIVLKALKPNIRFVWISELILIITILSTNLYQERKIIYEVDDSIEWFVIVENDHLSEKGGQYLFPFDRKFKIGNQKILFVDPDEREGFKNVNIKRDKPWKGNVSIIRNISVNEKTYRIQVFFQARDRINDDDFRLINEMIEQAID